MRCVQCGHDVFVEFGDGDGVHYFECDRCCMDYGPLGFKEIERLQAIIDKHPKTADGAPVKEGMDVFRVDKLGACRKYEIGSHKIFDDLPSSMVDSVSDYYSTPGAAKAASVNEISKKERT